MLDALGFVEDPEHREPTVSMLEELTPGELVEVASSASSLRELCYRLLDGSRGPEVLATAAVDAAMGRMDEALRIAREARRDGTGEA